MAEYPNQSEYCWSFLCICLEDMKYKVGKTLTTIKDYGSEDSLAWWWDVQVKPLRYSVFITTTALYGLVHGAQASHWILYAAVTGL